MDRNAELLYLRVSIQPLYKDRDTSVNNMILELFDLDVSLDCTQK